MQQSGHLKIPRAWINLAKGVTAEVPLHDRLFVETRPQCGGKDFIENLNPNSLKVLNAFVEPSVAAAKADDKFQFERLEYFVTDFKEHTGENPVFNRITSLKDSWAR